MTEDRTSGTARAGDWIQTFTGGQFWPLEPLAEEVRVDDIAHALALTCRYNGHCRVFYSVAEHSVRLSHLVARPLRMAALFHDAAEAYLGDIVRPVKRHLDVAAIEEAILAAVAEKVGFALPLAAEIKQADAVMLATECRDIMARPPNAWLPMPEPLPERIEPWPVAAGKERFLRRYLVIKHEAAG